MTDLVRRLSRSGEGGSESSDSGEWLITNGLGGYASGTVDGVITRRYHGLLIAALPAPLGRIVMLSDLSDSIELPDGNSVAIGGAQNSKPERVAAVSLAEFRLENGLPVWRYETGAFVLEKSLVLPHNQNTVHVTYRLSAGEGGVRLKLRPLLQFRPHEAPVSVQSEAPYVLTVTEDRYEVSAGILPSLRFFIYGQGTEFTIDRKKIEKISYAAEAVRGYEAAGDLWTPGYFVVNLAMGGAVTLVASTEPWDIVQALRPADALNSERERRTRLLAAAQANAANGFAAELVLAADQFIITPAGRLQDATRAYAAGDEMRTAIAGYHWFTDWGRDTMISLEGLTLATRRYAEAGWILRGFAETIRDGLIPNLFPEGMQKGLYHTADATLWFFHAIDVYLRATADRITLRLLLPKLLDIIEHHLRGTRFGIGVDSEDGLLRQGEPGYALTWMDAKVEDWVVTPRRGKAVEINALWYSALRLLEQWLREELDGGAAARLAELAERARRSFNARFWYGEGGYLFDVVDGEQGDDAACRPNQLFAISLRYPVLDPERWKAVLDVVQERLLTPRGLRTLDPADPNYKAQYFGDLRARDAAYHQGTVWAWLMGPFIDAWLKVYPADRQGAARFLEGFAPHLQEACIGTISEIFDGNEPFSPRGCIAQAWSVAEILRSWVKTHGPQ